MTDGGIKSVFASEGRPGLWIDYLDYARRLFLGGDDPWGDPARFVNVFTQAQKLLKSDLIDVRVEDYGASWLIRDGAALKPARRPTSDLKQIVGDDGFRAGVSSILAALADLARGCAGLALTLPSPRRWLRLGVERCGGDADQPLDEDHIEMSAMYIADFLRAFADAGVSAILFEEDPDPGPGSLALYQPVLNVAAGYQWSVGLLVPDAVTRIPDGDIDVCFVDPESYTDLADNDADGGTDVTLGVSIPSGYWAGKDDGFVLPENCQAAYARIPVDANPEQVLERLAALI